MNTKSFDAGPHWVVQKTNAASADITSALDITAAQGSTTGQYIIDDLLITSEVEQNITVRDDAGTALVGPLLVAAKGYLPLTLRNQIAVTVGKKAQVIGTAAGNVKVYCSYHDKGSEA
jgi:hypothetical protein